MAAKSIIRFVSGATLLLALAACTYPFVPELETDDDRLVVEGGIHIGSTSTFEFSRVYPFTANERYTPPPVKVSGYLETDGGGRIYPVADGALSGTRLSFDTSKSSPDERYRLHFEEENSNLVFESDWLDVAPAPIIDNLSYNLDYDRSELNVALSMHCQGMSHFRWYYDETWEYHADLRATHYFDFESLTYPYTDELELFGAFRRFPSGVNTYYCWKTQRSPEMRIFSTADQVEDRFTDLNFHRVRSDDRKLEMVYRLTVYLEALSDEAYLYWKNIEDNSQNQGTLFSPVPNQMKGNVHCVTDPAVEVIGYVSASSLATAHMYYDNTKDLFFNGHVPDPSREVEIFELQPQEFVLWYLRGYLPYLFTPGEIGAPPLFQWAKDRCVDCRLAGGTKDKPEDWPNEHY